MAGISGLSVDVGSITAMVKAMDMAETKLRIALKLLADTASKKMEEWAKENAPWENRTSNARQGLLGEGYWENEDVLVCAIMHQVDYGIWLELAMEKKYAILEQAMSQHSGELLAQYKKLVGGL